MLFSPKSFTSLKHRLHRRYKARLSKILKDLKKLPGSKTGQWLSTHANEFSNYSALHWYYLQQVEHFIFYLMNQDELSRDESFTEIDNEIFEQWNKSEFADVFLKLLNQGLSISVANKKAMKILDEHLIALGNFHLLKINHPNKNYRIQPSLGDQKKQNKITQMLGTTLHLDGKELKLMTLTMKEMKYFSHRIELALKLIKNHSATSWERFSAFTEVIIPIKQEEFVSYSHQELPGTSMINLYDRDFVDLMDDLIHENGHHHLNYYLNLEKLIDEPLDCIYYSPWRRTLRPLRGIYHAYFTFFWAFKLFSDFIFSFEENSSIYQLSEEEKEKIIWRTLEEFLMLKFTFEDLKWARKNNLVTDAGWAIIKEQQTYIQKFNRKIPQIEKHLKAHKKDYQNLKKTLKSASEKFSKK
jgi:hypothetical protein